MRGNIRSYLWQKVYGLQHLITKKLSSMQADARRLLQEKTGKL
jgi:hypothetical protein